MTAHTLPERARHARWDNSLPAALEIASGDVVSIETEAATGQQLLPGDTSEALAGINWSQVHPLSGPIAVEGAEPGDTLEVRVLECTPGPWGYGAIDPTFGLLMERFREPRLRFFELDRGASSFEFLPGVRLQLAPFMGVMGVAPPGPERTTFAPGAHGGNIDCRELVVGSSLFLPVLSQGALFSCGDGHALQGDGEICTAVECEMSVTLGFRLHKQSISARPLAVSHGKLITIGSGATLLEALQEAGRDMVAVLHRELDLSEEDAYMLMSLAADARINELVNASPVVFGAKFVLPLDAIGGDWPEWALLDESW